MIHWRNTNYTTHYVLHNTHCTTATYYTLYTTVHFTLHNTTLHTSRFTALCSFLLPLFLFLRKPLGNCYHGNMINWRYSSHWTGIDQPLQDKQEQDTHIHMLFVTAVTFDLQMIYEHSRVTDTLAHSPNFSSLRGRLSITACRSLFSHISVHIGAQLWGEAPDESVRERGGF